MYKYRGSLFGFAAGLIVLATLATANANEEIQLTSSGPIAFAPEGILLISDPMAATIYAVETGDTAGSAEGVSLEVADIKSKIAGMMGAPTTAIQISDLAINPINGRAYLSVVRGSGDEAVSTILTVDPSTQAIKEFSLEGKKTSQTTLPNAAESKQGRGGNQRMTSITDMAFIDDQVYVAGLSNEEFASNLRALPFPFTDNNKGCSIEVYHGAHGKFETRSPIRTFASYIIDDEVNLLAAYTCTPLVRIPVTSLKPETKVQGTTIAELGNRNRPLDMVVYKKDGKDFALMANSSRGVMKIDLATAGQQTAITTPVPGGKTEGVPYETIAELKGVLQLDGLNATHAVVLVQGDDKKEHLKTIPLP